MPFAFLRRKVNAYAMRDRETFAVMSEDSDKDLANRHERRSRWNFAFADELWNWSVARPDGSVVVSGESFRTPHQCAEDAVRNGYVAWPASQERRKTRPANPLSVYR